MAVNAKNYLLAKVRLLLPLQTIATVWQDEWSFSHPVRKLLLLFVICCIMVFIKMKRRTEKHDWAWKNAMCENAHGQAGKQHRPFKRHRIIERLCAERGSPVTMFFLCFRHFAKVIDNGGQIKKSWKKRGDLLPFELLDERRGEISISAWENPQYYRGGTLGAIRDVYGGYVRQFRTTTAYR